MMESLKKKRISVSSGLGAQGRARLNSSAALELVDAGGQHSCSNNLSCIGNKTMSLFVNVFGGGKSSRKPSRSLPRSLPRSVRQKDVHPSLRWRWP